MRRTFEAFIAGDLDAVTSVFTADASWESVGLGTSLEGTPAIRGSLEDWRSRYEDYEIEVADVQDLGNGVVLVKSSQGGRPVGSSAHDRLPREPMYTRSSGSRPS